MAGADLKFYHPPAEEYYMNISSGLSSITLNSVADTGSVSREKIYLWPSYGEGQVRPVRSVTPRIEPNLYLKATPKERDDLVELSKKPDTLSYQPDGSILKSHSRIAPGMLFNALA